MSDSRVESRVSPDYTGAVDTLGGLAFVLAESVPPIGTVVTHPSGWRMEVTDADETHVKRLRLHPAEAATEPES